MDHSANSRISPGWQFNTLQIDSSVLNRMAFAFPVLSIERLALNELSEKVDLTLMAHQPIRKGY